MDDLLSVKKNGLCVKNESFLFFLLSIKRQTKIVGLASHDTLDDVMFLFVGFLLARSTEWGFPSTRPPDALSRRRQARKLLSRLLCCHAIKKESNDRSSKSDEIPARSRHPWGLVRDTDCISPTRNLIYIFSLLEWRCFEPFPCWLRQIIRLWRRELRVGVCWPPRGPGLTNRWGTVVFINPAILGALCCWSSLTKVAASCCPFP